MTIRIPVEIASIRHKALRQYAETGWPKGIAEPERLARMLAFIAAAATVGELGTPPNFGFHPLTGDRKGHYAMTVTRNWRLTFTHPEAGVVADLDLEDYHGR